MNFEDLRLRLIAGVKFSQPIKNRVVKKWRLLLAVLLIFLILVVGVHYWAQNVIGPFIISPLCFSFLLAQIEPTVTHTLIWRLRKINGSCSQTRLLTIIFYISLVSTSLFISLIGYTVIATGGYIVMSGTPSIVTFSLYLVDTCLSLLTLCISLQMLNEHDLPDFSFDQNEVDDDAPSELNELSNETQPLWKSFEGTSYKIDESVNV